MERHVQLAYTKATNIYTLGSDFAHSDFAHSDLIDAVSRFEKTELVGFVDPFTSRRGHWILIYGIIQTLADISVDAPSVRYRGRDVSGAEVSYHLSPRFRGTANTTNIPPWKSGSVEPPDPSNEFSHCWTAPTAWHKQRAEESGIIYDEVNEWDDSKKENSAYSHAKGRRSYSGGYASRPVDDKTAVLLPDVGSQVHDFPRPRLHKCIQNCGF